MPKRTMSSTPGVYLNKTGWTGKCLPVTVGTEEIHAEIAKEQVYHYTQAEILRLFPDGRA